MTLLKKILKVFVSLSLLNTPASTAERGPQLSLWGEVASFSQGCSPWRLRHVFIPALQELTVCFNLKFEVPPSSVWTAFMYRHPDIQQAELGLGGKPGRLVVWLCGTEWTTQEFNFGLSQWYSVCLTWSHTKDRPDLYINGRLKDLLAFSFSTPCSTLTPGGTLTLGASHTLNNNNIEIIPLTVLLGKLSLFRLWGRERTKQEVTSLICTEGDIVKWEAGNWDTQICAPLPDSKLRCEWSFYEVRLTFAIFRYDGNNTDFYMARDEALRWLEEVLPVGIYLHRLTMYEIIRDSEEDSLVKLPQKEMLERWSSPSNRYDCLVHVSATPSMNVADVQKQMYNKLSIPYDPSDLLQLLTDRNSIYTTPVESMVAATIDPLTKPVGVTEAYPVTATTFTTAISPTTFSPTITFKTTTITSSTSTSEPSTTTSSTSTSEPTTTTSSTSTSEPTTTTSSTSTSEPSTTTSSTPTSEPTTTTSSTSTSKPTTTTSSTSTNEPTTTTSSTSTSKPTTTTSSTSTSKPTTTTSSTSTSKPTTTTSSTSTSKPTTTTSSTSTNEPTTATFTTSSTNLSELYFEVNISVSITGDCDPEQILFIWLNSSLPEGMMIVPDLQLLPKVQRRQTSIKSKRSTSDGVSAYKVSRESCIFQVQVMMSQSDIQEMEKLIRDQLLIPYNNGSISIATEDIKISRILIVTCEAEIQQTRKGLFEWTAISGGRQAIQPCPKDPQLYATRYCKLSVITHWMVPDMEACPLVVETIPDLDNIDVTAENAMDVVEMIEDLLNNHSTLNYQELVTVLDKLQDVIDLSVVRPCLGQALINVISNILESDSNLVPFTNTILNITEAVGDKMVGYKGFFTLAAPALAISVVDVVPGEFCSLTFGVSSDRSGTNPEIFINRNPHNSTVAFIYLPPVLQHNFPEQKLNEIQPRVQFQFYGIPVLFKSTEKGKTLNTFVVSASVTNASSPVKDLAENVKVTLQHLIPNTLYKDVQCVYWNFNKNNGHGGWDDYGCRKYNSSSDYTTCLCDHLTHFGVLLDVSRTEVDPANEQILTIITYVGCGVSSVFLGITVLTYTAFEKLRRDYPSQILINLSLALLGLNLVFLVNSWLSSWGLYGLCVAAASMLHYFLLASFTWMGLEAVNMYFALVKVFNVYVPSYILKFCVLGWGLPLVVCIMVLSVNREAYGSHFYTDAQSSLESLDNTDNFCWLQDKVTFYVSVVAYAVLVFLFNTAVFVVVLMQIRHMRVNSPAGTRSGLIHDLRGVASITLLLGLTWTVGFFTWGPARVVMLYLFSGLNTLQGLFIFLFHCLMKENVRKQWRIHLCFGPFRTDEYSEWSNSASAGVVAKPRSLPPRASVPSVRSVKSSSTESTSASSDSSQRDSSYRRPNLGLFVNSLALPRAQRIPSGIGAPHSQRDMNPTPGWRNHLLSPQEQR